MSCRRLPPLLCFAIAACGCAAAEQSPSAWERFESYRASIAGAASEDLHQEYLSQNILDALSAAPSEQAAEMQAHLRFPLRFETVKEHFQKQSAETSCLTVNGLSPDGEPLTATVEYVTERSRLVINDVHVIYWQDRGDYPRQAMCPTAPVR